SADRSRRVDGGVREMTRGVELGAVLEDLEALAKVLDRRAQISDTEEGGGEPGWPVEHGHRAGEALASEQRGQQPVHRSLSWVEGLGHGSERLFEAGGLCPRNAERLSEVRSVQSEQLSGRRCRSEMSEHAGDVPSAIGECAADDATEARFHLE